MKLFGSITELVSAVFRKNNQAITTRPNQSTTYTASRDIQLPPGDADHVLVSANSTQTLTNKVLSGNTATNLVSGSGTFTFNTSGTLTAPNATDTLVGKATTDTLTNKTLTGNTAANLISGSGTLVLNTSGTATVPNATDTLVGKATTDTLTNKTLTAPVLSSYADYTEISTPSNPSAGVVRVYSKSGDALYTLNSSGTESQLATTATAVDLSSAQTLSNKSLVDNTTFIIDNGDATKKMKFEVSGISTATTRTLTIQDSDQTLVGRTTTDTLTNKTLTAPVQSSYEDFTEIATPATPGAGVVRFYSKSGDQLYYKNSAGTEKLIADSGTGVDLSSDQTIAGMKTFVDGVFNSQSSNGSFSPSAINQITNNYTISSSDTVTLTTSANWMNLGTLLVSGTLTITSGVVECLDAYSPPAAVTAQITSNQIRGSSTNDFGNAGYLGEYLSSSNSGGVTLSSNVWTNITSITLSPGDWDVSGTINFQVSGSSGTAAELAVSQFSGTTTTDHSVGDNDLRCAPPTTSYDTGGVIPTWRVSTAGSPVVYVKARMTFAGSGFAEGRISARRAR